MTVEEIKEKYRSNIERAEDQLLHAMNDWPSEYDEAAYSVAIEAMDKQIPQKPVNLQNALSDKEYVKYNCPGCGKRKCKVPGEEKYCSECGQAICWDEQGESK